MAIIFKNALIIDGRGGLLDRGFVVVEKDRIAKVGRGNDPGEKNGHEIVDLEGRTILPGLIDCHVHLCLDGSADPLQSLRGDSMQMATLKAARNAYLSLLAGVTTVRDLGSLDGITVSLRDAINLGITIGPRIVCCNQAVCITGGQGWEFNRQADGVDEVRQAVREQFRAGANCIKLMSTGGVMTPGVDTGAAHFTYEELRSGVEEAHKAGRKAASHAQGNDGIKNSLRANIDTIEHRIFLDNEAIGLFLEKKTVLVPTLSAPFNIMEKGEKSGIPAFVIEKTKRVKDTHIESAKKAYQ